MNRAFDRTPLRLRGACAVHSGCACPFLAVLLALTLAGCAKARPRASSLPPLPAIGAIESGLASWYGYPYHGRASSSGEVYDMEQMTAAHRTLPFGTRVRVLNLDNDRACEVRINDRGPFIDGRIIDLSRAAARSIAMLGPGLARVQVEILELPPQTEPGARRTPRTPEPAVAAPVSAPEPNPAVVAADPAPKVAPLMPGARGKFAVQVGAFRDRANADRFRGNMERKFGSARVAPGAAGMWRVLIGEEVTVDAAEALASRLSAAGTAGIIVRIEP